METMRPPDVSEGYPSRGVKLGPAWTELWKRLYEASRSTDPYLDGKVLAEEVAPDYGLADSTLIALLARAAKAGLLVSERRGVEGARGVRRRAFYRSGTHG